MSADSTTINAMQGAGLTFSCLGHMLESLNEGVLVFRTGADGDGPILYANARYCEMSGRERDDLIGKKAEDLYDQEALEYLATQVAAGCEGGCDRLRFEFHVPHVNGTRTPVVTSSRVSESPCGDPYVVVTCTDITEQKNAQDQLEEANRHLRDYHEELQRDLQIAEEVQRTLMPTHERRFGPYRVATRYIPMIGVGGDYVFAHPNEEEQSAYLTVCDVAGHGIAASLIANYIHGQTRSILGNGIQGPSDLLEKLNVRARGVLRHPVTFFTYAAAQLDLQEHTVKAACGGHPPILHVARDGEVNWLSGPYSILGVFENPPCTGGDATAQLRSGDRLILYTDGIPEAHPQGTNDLYGEERFAALLRDNRHKDPQDIADIVVDAISTHTDRRIADDVTLMIAALD